MRTKVTLVLLFLNAALFFVIFHFERTWRTEGIAREVRRRVLGAEAADIRSLSVVSAAPAGSFSLERRGDGWLLTKPVEWRANPAAVSRIINDLQFLENETSFAVRDVEKNGQSLADYGLDHPKLTVTITSGGPDTTGGSPVTTTLRIGDATKVGQHVYLLSADGERIHVLGRELVDSLSLPLEQLRSDAVLTIPVFEARALNLQTSPPTGVLVVIQKDGNRWWFETPIPARASKEAVDLAISGLDALRVGNFAPPAASPPEVRVTIVGNNRQETLYIEGPVDEGVVKAGLAQGKWHYAQLEDPLKPSGRTGLFIVAVPDALMETLRHSSETLRDKHVLDFDLGAVTGVTLRAPNQTDLTLRRDPGAAGDADWQIVLRGDAAQGPSTLHADRAAVQRLLEQLTLLSAEQFKSDAPQERDLEQWGFMSPERTITLTLQPPAPGAARAGGPPPVSSPSEITLQIGRSTQRSDPYVNARRLGDAQDALSVYAVDPEILRQTPMAPSAWRDRMLPSLPASAKISGLKITDLETNRVIWEWAEASAKSDRPANAAALQVVLDQVRNPRAQRFTSNAFSASDRSWRYRLDAAVALPGGAGGEQTSVRTLWLASRAGGTEQIAGSAEFGAVYAIEQPFVDALWTLTYGDRDPGPAPPAPNP